MRFVGMQKTAFTAMSPWQYLLRVQEVVVAVLLLRQLLLRLVHLDSPIFPSFPFVLYFFAALLSCLPLMAADLTSDDR